MADIDIPKEFWMGWGIKEGDMERPEVKAFFERISWGLSKVTMENYKNACIILESMRQRAADTQEASSLLNGMLQRMLPAHREEAERWVKLWKAGGLSLAALPKEEHEEGKDQVPSGGTD